MNIKNSVTEKTNMVLINEDDTTIDNEFLVEKAKKISSETGIPLKMIYSNALYQFTNRWHKIDGEWYFFKKGSDRNLLNELLGEQISKYFNLETAEYNLAKIEAKESKTKNENVDYGVVTKNICSSDKEYLTAWDIPILYQSDLSYLDKFKSCCKTEEEYKKLLRDLKKLCIRDFYSLQLDRRGNNILFAKTEEGIRLAPLYDNENAFEAQYPYIYRNHFGALSLRNHATKKNVINDDDFQELLNKLMDASIDKFMEKVEDQQQILIPKEEKNFYRKKEKSLKKEVAYNRVIR